MGAAGALGALAGLAACSGSQDQDQDGDAPAADGSALEAPAADAYPIEPDAEGAEAKWTAEKTADGWTRITQEGAPTLGVMDEGKIIQVAGYAFKDLNGSGKLEFWEDWRQDSRARAQALAAQMSIEEITPLIPMLFFSFQIMSGELTDDEKAALDSGRREAMIGVENVTQNIRGWVEHYNLIQAYAEADGAYGIPVHYCSDPINGNYEVAGARYPSQPGIGASFDPDVAKQTGSWVSRVFRAVGVNMHLGPQIDTTTEPTWGRAEGTYGEDPALVRDLARSFVDGMQSTIDDAGNDLGWGTGSTIACVKHYPGDGASQFGRDSHNAAGRYSIFPNGNFATQLIPYVDGVFKLDGATGAAGAIMPSYSIAYSDDEEYGELVGTAFSAYKMSLAKAYGWQGLACSDWQIIDEDGSIPGFPMPMHNWGVKTLTPAQRAAKAIKCGTHLYGGQDDMTHFTDAYQLLVDEEGQEAADAYYRTCGEEILNSMMMTGLFENTYLDADASREAVYSDENVALGHELCHRAVVMLKNDGAIAKDAISADTKVYVPMKFASTAGFLGGWTVSIEMPASEEVLGGYFDMVTDTVGEFTGDPDDDGNPTPTYDDLKRASADDLADCKYAIVIDSAPYAAGGSIVDTGESGYNPTTLQYAAFTADAASGCPEYSIAHVDADGIEENLSPYGNTNQAPNSNLPELLGQIRAALPEDGKIILVLNATNPMVPAEVEPLVDALLVSYTTDAAAMLDIACGKVEPTGLLPWQQPKDMHEVFSQASDTPRDMDCYVDAAGNAYDFGFGLNWSGVIDDERTAKYCVAPLLVPEAACDESLIVK